MRERTGMAASGNSLYGGISPSCPGVQGLYKKRKKEKKIERERERERERDRQTDRQTDRQVEGSMTHQAFRDAIPWIVPHRHAIAYAS